MARAEVCLMGIEFGSAAQPQQYAQQQDTAKDAANAQAAASQANVAAQTQANRPNVSTPFSQTQWSQDGAGNWTMNQSLSPQVQAAYGQMTPFSFDQFGQMPTGDGARQQAISAAYDQSASRLNPQFAQREEQLRAQLAAQGIDPNSEAGRGSMAQLTASRNDAFGGAMNSAIMQGTQAGESMFRQGMQGRQQAISEALRQRAMPMSDLQDLMGFTQQQPEFAKAGVAQAPDLLGAELGRLGIEQQDKQAYMEAGTERDKSMMQFINSLMGLFGKAAM
jgi:hypothetical protein